MEGVQQRVRVVFVGDQHTGKTSFIYSAVYGYSYAMCLPSTLHPFRIADTDLIDTSANYRLWSLQMKPLSSLKRSSIHITLMVGQKLHQELKQADVMVLTHACDVPATLARIHTYWLPILRELENPEIEICIESSAKENIRIRKVLEASRIATNYPSSPLFDQNRILKPQCMSALTRIFRLLDTDNDGCLSEEDVDSFEYTCFHTLRLPPEMNNLKKEVAEILIDGVYDGGLTLTGFYHYFRRLREEGRLDLAWEVLKSFGWKDDSKFEIKFNVNFDQFNGDDFQQIEEQTRGMIVELTNEAVEFLKEIFYTYDIDGDGTLKGSEVEDFLPTAHGSDWSKGLYEVVAELGGLSIDKFLSEQNAIRENIDIF
ncbi:mitochondrial Rho GTPase 1-like isoform X4 [Apium graveolens]|uniref:mitochondrial Rho GTPase 1-like isoform X4 n=1 Tax=Apium graveolens TaxID=4045 RepID=UPI003D7B67AE